MNRIKELRKKGNIKQTELCQTLGITQGALSGWENERYEPDIKSLKKMTDIFNVSMDYLLGRTDFSAEENLRICHNITKLIETVKNPPNTKNIKGIEGALHQIQKNEYQFTYEILEQIASYFGVGVSVLTAADSVPVQKSKGVKIPVLGHVAAGLPIEAVEDILDYEEISEDMAARGDHFALKIKGDSMEPRIKAGDVVIVRQQSQVESGDVAIVLVNGDNATCKKVLLTNDGITLLPYNPSFEPIFYSADQVESLPVRILGKVVELRGKF